MQKSALFVTALALILVVSSCGFHLRGPARISDQFNPLYVEPGQLGATELGLLNSALIRAGARLSDSADSANHLAVSFSPLQKRNLAQSSPTGVQLVQLGMQLDYQVRTAAGEWLVENRQISHNAEIELDNNNVLSHEKLVQSAVKNLQQNLLRNMIFQLKQ